MSRIFREIFCGHFPWKLKDENLRKISPKFRRTFRRSLRKNFARTSLWGIAGTTILTDFWRLLDVPLFPIKQTRPIFDAFLTHFWRILAIADAFFRKHLLDDTENCWKIKKMDGIFLFCFGLALQLAPPHTGSPGPFGPENPGRVRKESRKSTQGQGPKSPERVRPGVPKESEKSLKPDFWTLFGLFWDSGAHSFGTFGALSLGTLSGLFSDAGFSGPKGPGDSVWGGANCKPCMLLQYRLFSKLVLDICLPSSFGSQAAPHRGLSGPLGPRCRKNHKNVFWGLRPWDPEKSLKTPRDRPKNTLQTLSAGPETSQTVPETFWRLFLVPFWGDMKKTHGQPKKTVLTHYWVGFWGHFCYNFLETKAVFDKNVGTRPV